MDFEKINKENIDNDIILEEDNIKTDNRNIFDELSGELEVTKDTLDAENEDKHSLKNAGNIIGIINIVLFVIILFSSLFFYIQNNEDFSNKTYLSPFCSILLGSDFAASSSYSCSGVKAKLIEEEEKLSDLKNEQFSLISEILPKKYILDNFLFSKEVQFLLNKTENKLKVLSILEEFDNLLRGFYGVDKGQIQCSKMSINSDSTLNIKCDLFTSNWNSEILGYDGTSRNYIGGTSITLASSFINYIDKEAKNFKLINKQKSFVKDDYVGVGYYTQKTSINLDLKYNGDLDLINKN